MRFSLLSIILIFLSSCSEKKPDFYYLGLKSYNVENYSLAKNQLSMIKEDHSMYQTAQIYLKKIESLEKLNSRMVQEKYLFEKKINDSLLLIFSGNYKIEVDGVSSKDAVEVYLLKNDGTAEWLWVYDIANSKRIDDRKNGWWTIQDNIIKINIRGNSGVIEEVYKSENGSIRNTQLKRRFLRRTLVTF